MAKKDKKKSQKKDNGSRTASPADAVRAAVEQAFTATAGGAASTRGRAQDIVDDIASAANRVRDALDDLRVVDDLKGLRSEVEALSRRVAALEAAPAPATKAGASTPRRAASKSPTATQKPAAKPAATRRAGASTAKKPAKRAAAPKRATPGTKPAGTRAPKAPAAADTAPKSATGRS